jgi:hypothetical protein
MAFVHPSRMALVPKDSRSLPSSGTRLLSPPASPPRDRSVDRYRRRSRDEEYNGERERGGRRHRSRDSLDRDAERRRDRGRSSDRDQDRHQSHHHRSTGDRYYDDRRNEHRDGNSRAPRSRRDDRSSVRSPPPPSRPPPLGRASPTYDDYTRRQSAPSPPPQDDRSGRPSAPPENAPPWHHQENMYRREGRPDGGGDYFERYGWFMYICLWQKLSSFFFLRRRQQRINSTLSIWPSSPRAPARDLCVFSMFFKYIIFKLLLVGHSSETEKYAKGIDVIVPLPFHIHRQIVKRNGGVAKEKNASGGGKKRIGESGDIDVHKVLRMMRLVGVIVIARGDAVGRQAENIAKLGHEHQARAARSQVMKMNGWKNLHLLAPLCPQSPLLSRR